MASDQFTVTVKTPPTSTETGGGVVEVKGANYFTVEGGHLVIKYGTTSILAIFAPGQWVSATAEDAVG